jgi:creatinine amidohydrolase
VGGNIYNIERLTCAEIDNLDRNKTLFLIAISPLEEHGPHLPVGVDAFNADFFARLAAELVVKTHPDFDVALFPLMPVGTQVYKYIGSFQVKPATVYDLTYGVGRSMARYGFKFIFVFSAHGTPRQIVAIEAACRKLSRKYKIKAHSLTGALTAKFLKGEMYDDIARELGRTFTEQEKELLRYDYHAGWWETSMMLKIMPDLVNKNYGQLKPYLKNPATGKALTPEVRWQGYIGSPARATPEFAVASIKIFSRETVQLISRCIKGENISDELASPFFKYPIFRPFFKRNVIIGLAAIVFLVMLMLLVKAYF